MDDILEYALYLVAALIIVTVVIIIMTIALSEDDDKKNRYKKRRPTKQQKQVSEDFSGYFPQYNRSSRNADEDYARLKAEIQSQKQPSLNKVEYETTKQAEKPMPPHKVSSGLLTTQCLPSQELIIDYNRAVKSGDPSDFKKKYRSRARIGVKNTEDRLINPDVDPIFVDHDAGNYWGIELNGKICVVPRLELTFVETHNGPGGMSYVFRYSGFDVTRKYTKLTVIEPAIFSRNSGGYSRIKQGRLNLGEGVER